MKICWVRYLCPSTRRKPRPRFGPGPDRVAIERAEPSNFRHQELRRICARAGVGHRATRDNDGALAIYRTSQPTMPTANFYGHWTHVSLVSAGRKAVLAGINEDSSPATTISVLEDADEGLRVVKRAEIAAPPFSFGARTGA